jgi:UMF1 family MFS transporter
MGELSVSKAYDPARLFGRGRLKSRRPGRSGSQLSASALSWALFESARTPFVVVISIYVFVPFIAGTLASNPVQGQALVASFTKWSGIAAAASALLFGASVDHMGRRKPWLAGVVGLSVVLTAMLWFAEPGGRGLSLGMTAMILAIIGVLYGLSEVLHNGMLVYATTRPQRAYASGLALALGSAFSLIVLIILLWGFVLPGSIHSPFLPRRPLLGLSPLSHEPERFSAPLVAIVMALGSVPLFLCGQDAPSSGSTLPEALRRGVTDLGSLFRTLTQNGDTARFLLARTIFADGIGGLVLFSGVYAAGVLGWSSEQLILEGLASTVFGVVGGIAAGLMDGRLGAKRSLQFSLSAALLCVIGEIGLAKNRLFYFWPYSPLVNGRPWHGPIFNTWPEWTYIGLDFALSALVTASYASARTQLASMAPRDRVTSFFAIYSLTGRATAWLCPLLIGVFTSAFVSQQAGFIPIAILIGVGLLVLGAVKDKGATVQPAPDYEKPTPDISAPLTHTI